MRFPSTLPRTVAVMSVTSVVCPTRLTATSPRHSRTYPVSVRGSAALVTAKMRRSKTIVKLDRGEAEVIVIDSRIIKVEKLPEKTLTSSGRARRRAHDVAAANPCNYQRTYRRCLNGYEDSEVKQQTHHRAWWEDRLGALNTALAAGTSTIKSAQKIQTEWKAMTDVSTPTLAKRLTRYRADILPIYGCGKAGHRGVLLEYKAATGV